MSLNERLWAIRRETEQLAALALALRLEAMAQAAWRDALRDAGREARGGAG